MIGKTVEELEELMGKLKTYIENDTPLTIELDVTTLGFLHDVLLDTKIVTERMINFNKISQEEREEINEIIADSVSDMEGVIYPILNIIKNKE